MKSCTAIAAVLAAVALVPSGNALAKAKHPAHAAASHSASHGHAAKGHGAKHTAAGHAGAGHGKKGKAAAAKAGKHGHKGKVEKHVKAPPPPPPPKPQVLVPPSRADRIVLPANVTPSHYDLQVTPSMTQDSFTGRARIDVEVKTATRQIKLNAAELTFSTVSLAGTTGAALTPKWVMDPVQETATLNFANTLKPGRYALTIAYAGKINASAAGLFHLDYGDGDTRKRALYTQFENSDARRFMPCWDEPSRKATFSLAVDAPADQMAVSNMPQVSAELLPSGLKRYRFRETPLMSSYLLFMGLGDFERVTRTVGATEIGVVVKHGDTARAAYALDAAAALLPYYNDYFGTAYPLPKLDLIAAPGSSQFFSAMENWGAILFFEDAALVDPALATESDKQVVFTDVAHEMAHQWFGDLVTMEWWDDLWLNEGFASWMQTKATGHFHPEWRLELKAMRRRDGAMALDARDGSHAVFQHVRDVNQASQAFDGLTYQKGAAVIGMLEDHVGADVFRAGLRRYIQDHARGSAVTDDLWKAIDAVSPVKITGMAHDFTLQPGVPLITVSQDGAGASLIQTRFGVDAASRAKLRWEVPVLTARAYGAGVWKGLVSTVEPASLKAPVDGLVVNAGQSGYYRTHYEGAMFTRLAEAWPRLTPADQIGLLNDTSALALNGDQPMAELLGLMDRAGADLDPVVALSLVDRFVELARVERDLPGEVAFQGWAQRRLQAIKARLEADPRAATDPNRVILKAALVDALVLIRDPKIVEEARARYAAWKADPAALKADDRSVTLKAVAVAADAATWAELHAFAQKAATFLEREEFYELLASAQDPALAKQALDLSVSPEVPPTLGPEMIRRVAARYPDMALEFALSHPDELAVRLEASSRTQYIPGIAGLSSDLIAVEKLDAYAAVNIPATARRAVTLADSKIRYLDRIRTTRVADMDRWIAAHPN